MWFKIAMPTSPAAIGPRLSGRWVESLLFKPQAATRLWEPPSDTGWAMISDVQSFRAGVPDALIQWRRARDETRPNPML